MECVNTYICVTVRLWRQIWKDVFWVTKGITGQGCWGVGERPGEASQKGRKKKPYLGLSGFIRETGTKIPILFLSQRLNEDFTRQC